MTDYTTPDEASQESRDYRAGYYAGKEYAEFQAGVQMGGLRKTIADLQHERDSIQRTYIAKTLAQCEEIAQARAIIEALYDDDTCYYDHHGWCQAHYASFDDKTCVNVAAKEWLKTLALAATAPQGD